MARTMLWLWLGCGGLGACQPGRLEECDGLTPAQCAALFGAGGTGGQAPDDGTDVRASGAQVTAATRLPACAAHATVGELERDLLAARCGTSGCHVPGGVFKPDLKSAEAWKRLVDTPTQYRATHCKSDSYIARAAPLASYFLSVVKDAQPTCADGTAGGPPMPFAKPHLPDDAIACVEDYVQVVAGGLP